MTDNGETERRINNLLADGPVESKAVSDLQLNPNASAARMLPRKRSQAVIVSKRPSVMPPQMAPPPRVAQPPSGAPPSERNFS